MGEALMSLFSTLGGSSATAAGSGLAGGAGTALGSAGLTGAEMAALPASLTAPEAATLFGSVAEAPMTAGLGSQIGNSVLDYAGGKTPSSMLFNKMGSSMASGQDPTSFRGRFGNYLQKTPPKIAYNTGGNQQSPGLQNPYRLGTANRTNKGGNSISDDDLKRLIEMSKNPAVAANMKRFFGG